jgi:signal transduction histidine kinase/DNA-binding response OmpR family regulator
MSGRYEKMSRKELVARLRALEVQDIDLQLLRADERYRRHATDDWALEAASELLSARYSELYELAPVPFITLDSSGIICDMNLAAVTLLKCQRQMAIAAPFLPRVAPPHRMLFLNHMHRCRRDNTATTALKMITGLGSQTTMQMSSIAVSDGRRALFRTVLIDISTLAFAQEEVERLNTELEKRVEMRTAELAMANRRLSENAEELQSAKASLEQALEAAAEANRIKLKFERRARNAAERANRGKDEFLAILSHELRTPLNAMLGWTQILRTERLGGADAERGLEAIERNIRAQTQLINDLLDVSRILSGKLALEMQLTEAKAVVESALDSVRLSAEAKGVRLETGLELDPVPIRADPGRLQQVLLNLLTNAIKFTPAGGLVRIVSRHSGDRLEIEVSDTGAGIGPEFLPHIFDRFQQADSSTTRSQGGLGLGLSIARHLVEAHEGTIQAASDGPGKGAVFTIRLPRIRIDAIREPTRERPRRKRAGADTPALDGVRVLVVENDSDSRDLLARELELLRASVETAESVREALRRIETFRPEVLVSDIAMPEQDGYDLIRAIRSLPDEDLRRIPALALTAFARSEDRERALHAGFQAHLGKPVDLQQLAQTVQDLAASRNETSPSPQELPESPAVARRVLVVDDDPDSSEYLATILRAQGHEVLTATDGPSATEVASLFHPAVVLLDIVLPDIDGNELAARLREEPGLSGAVFIAVTGYSPESGRLQLGLFDSCLTKPVDPDAVLRAVQSRGSARRSRNSSEV